MGQRAGCYLRLVVCRAAPSATGNVLRASVQRLAAQPDHFTLALRKMVDLIAADGILAPEEMALADELGIVLARPI